MIPLCDSLRDTQPQQHTGLVIGMERGEVQLWALGGTMKLFHVAFLLGLYDSMHLSLHTALHNTPEKMQTNTQCAN